MVDNCCKLRYMNDLGGIKAVPEKPNLTNVTTRTPFMTILHQILPQQDNMQLLIILFHRLLTLLQLLSISIALIEQIPLQKAVSTLLGGGHVEPVTGPVNLPRILVSFPVNLQSVEMHLLRHPIFCCSEERAAEQVLLVVASASPSWTDTRRDHQTRRSIYVGL